MWFLLFLFLLAVPAKAQDSTPSAQLFNQYQSDYLYQYNLYGQAYADYSDKKQIFAKYGTVTTQNDAFLAAVTAINARSRVFESYLMALRVMLDNYRNANPVQTAADQAQLSSWESWFNDQITVVSAITNAHDLQLWVKTFQGKYNQIQQSIYTALVQNEVNLRQLTFNQAQSLVSDMQASPHFRPDSQQWFQNFSDKSNLISAGLNDALSLTKKNQLSDRFSNFYPAAQTSLNLTKNYLIGISSDLKLTVINFYQP